MTREPLAPAARIWVTVALAIAVFMEILDSTIANVAIPHIAGSLAASASQGTWVITAYGIGTAISIPLTGWLARRLGEVKLFVLSVLGFVVGSVLCGLSSNLEMLVAFRLLQGLLGGPMVTLSQSLLLSNYPPDKKTHRHGHLGDEHHFSACLWAYFRWFYCGQLGLALGVLHQHSCGIWVGLVYLALFKRP